MAAPTRMRYEAEPFRSVGTSVRPATAVRACLVFAVQADGSEVTTVEALAGADGELSVVQEAFRECHGLQCGFCTPGFVVTVTAFLRDHPSPTDGEIRDALSGNLCRCTGYQGIIAAVELAAVRLNGTEPAE